MTVFLLPSNVTSKFASASKLTLLLILKSLAAPMINRGAVGSEEDFKAVLAYLSKYFGPLNVNKATAKELEEVLHVTPGEAAAIVRYRTENGDFKTLDALMSVPGVDGKLIETRKDRVAFK